MDHEDQIADVLEGLPAEYKTVIDQIEGRDTPPTLTEIHEKLLHHISLRLLAIKSYLQVQGISHLTSPLHTPEHNGIAERKHLHVMETRLTQMSQAKMSKKHWPFASAEPSTRLIGCQHQTWSFNHHIRSYSRKLRITIGIGL